MHRFTVGLRLRLEGSSAVLHVLAAHSFALAVRGFLVVFAFLLGADTDPSPNPIQPPITYVVQ